MWDAGLAHRDIKPANLLVRDGRLLLIDVAFAEVRPTPWRQAVDLANMMLCLALRSTAERVYQRALQYFTAAEVSEAFAAARGLALPSQLRHAIRASGRDLHEEFLQLLPRLPRRSGFSAGARAGWAPRLVLVAVSLLVIIIANVLFSSATPATALCVTSMDCHALEPLLAEAQSVPTASEVACIRPLPPGWTLSRVQALRGASLITLGNDRAGSGALQLTLTGHCAVGGPRPSRHPGRESGGCAPWAAVPGSRPPGTTFSPVAASGSRCARRPSRQR